jgi:hypothetical protein
LGKLAVVFKKEQYMFIQTLKSVVLAVLATLSLSAFSGANDPLFINLSTDELHRSTMAINFGKHHSANGHPLTIFLLSLPNSSRLCLK